MTTCECHGVESHKCPGLVPVIKFTPGGPMFSDPDHVEFTLGGGRLFSDADKIKLGHGGVSSLKPPMEWEERFIRLEKACEILEIALKKVMKVTGSSTLQYHVAHDALAEAEQIRKK